MKSLIYLILFTAGLQAFSQDSTFVKTVLAGSKITVPEDKIWVVNKVYVNNGEGYNILVNIEEFTEKYKHQTPIQVPSYIPEMELLDTKSTIWFQLHLKQIKK